MSPLSASQDYLEQQLLLPQTKAQVQAFTAWVAADPQRVQALVKLFLGKTYRTTQRAARVLSHVAEKQPGWLLPYLPQLVQSLAGEPGDAVKRNVLRLLQYTALPQELQGTLAGHCFAYLENPKEAIAVRAFAITVLARICRHEPELGRELELVLERLLPGAGPALRVRVRDARKAIGLKQSHG